MGQEGCRRDRGCRQGEDVPRTQVPADQIVNLAPPPEIHDYDEIQSQINEEMDKVTWRDVFAYVTGDYAYLPFQRHH